jgi:hypothetical protein
MTNICAVYSKRYAYVVDTAVVLCGVFARKCTGQGVRIPDSLNALQNSVIGFQGDARSTVKSKFYWWLLIIGRIGASAISSSSSRAEGSLLSESFVLTLQSQLQDYRQVVCSRPEGRPIEMSGAVVANAAVFEAVFSVVLSLSSRTQQVTVQSRPFTLDLENEYVRLCATIPWHMYGIRNRIQYVWWSPAWFWTYVSRDGPSGCSECCKTCWAL